MLHLQSIEPRALELLKKVMLKPVFRDFFLVGGTGLSLQLGHRISDDLDLFCTSSFEPHQLLPELEMLGTINVTGEANNTLNCFVNGIKTDFIRYPYPLIYDLTVTDALRIASIPDIAAMKLSAIAQRGSRKDFFDLYELLSIYRLKTLFDFFKKKYPQIDTFHVLRSLTYFEDAEPEQDPRLLKKITWDQVKRKIIGEVKENAG